MGRIGVGGVEWGRKGREVLRVEGGGGKWGEEWGGGEKWGGK